MLSSIILKARRRLVQMHLDAKVGHLGGNLSSIDFLMVLFHQKLGYEDEFVLSKGHSAGALYVALWSKGLISDDDLKTFHQDGTDLPGHPHSGSLVGVTFSTGSLGHGLSLACGLALARKCTSKPGRIYCLTSDGEWQEGSMWEALRFAVSQRLDNLTVVVDANGWQGFAETKELLTTERLKKQVESFGAKVYQVNGHDLGEMEKALEENTRELSVIFLNTVKGNGWPGLEDTMASHYLPPTENFFATDAVEK